jgi:hypothetical protein
MFLRGIPLLVPTVALFRGFHWSREMDHFFLWRKESYGPFGGNIPGDAWEFAWSFP